MGRVSLTEDYDDRSVIAKLNEMDKRVTENTTVVTSAEASAKASAQAAQETADRFAGSVGAVVQNANAQINASKAQVDQSAQIANEASASAQQSATTVATYDTRLTAVEDADTHNVKLEGNQTITGVKTFTQLLTSKSSEWRTNWIVPFYSKSMVLQPSDNAVFLVNDVVQDSQANLVSVDQIIHNNVNTVYRDWQLQSAHGNVDVTLEINANGEKYATAPTPSSNAPSNAIVNKAYVESTDGVTNNLVHRTANEKVGGIKEFAYNTDKHVGTHIESTSGYWVKLVKWTAVALRYNVVMTLLSPYYRDTNFYGKLMFGCWDITNFAHLDLISPYNWANRFKVTYDGNEVALWYNNTSGEYKLGINVFIDIECNGTDKSSRAILIPESEQVAENPDWTSFARVLDGTYKGWGA